MGFTLNGGCSETQGDLIKYKTNVSVELLIAAELFNCAIRVFHLELNVYS